MKKYVYLVLSFNIFISCNYYKLSKKNLLWQPYMVGDKLVFKSNTEELDTILISKINTVISFTDNLSLFSDRHEVLFVDTPKQNVIEIKALKKDMLLKFNIRLGKNKLYEEYPNIKVRLNELIKMKCNNNIYCIETKYLIDSISRYNSNIKNILWSNKLGYLKLVYNNEKSWELISFYRNNKKVY